MNILHLLKRCVAGNGKVHVTVDLACTQAAAEHQVVAASTRPGTTIYCLSRAVEVVIVPRPDGFKMISRVALSLLALALRFRSGVIHAQMMSSVILASAYRSSWGRRWSQRCTTPSTSTR